MPNSLKIGLDLDGVIIDHTSNKIQKAKELGYDIMPEETHGRILKRILSDSEYRGLQHYIYGEVSLTASAVEGALDAIKNLSQNHCLFIVSRRNLDDGGNVLGMRWLEQHRVLTYMPKENVFFVPHDESGSKEKIAKRIGIEIFLDDKLSMLKELESVKTRVLLDVHDAYPLPLPSEILKIKKWQEFTAMIKTIEEISKNRHTISRL